MSNFIERAQSKWEGCDRETLKQDAETLGVDLKGNWSDATAILRLCAAVGQIAPQADAKPILNKQDRPTVKPNLTTIGEWGGRCRDVVVFRPQGDNSPGAPVAWDQMRIYIPFDDGTGKKYTIPEPHYNVLKDAKLRHYDLTARRNESGDVIRTHANREEQTFPSGAGEVTIGTEHLPGSLLEWYQWEAERKDYFRKFKKSRLEEIYSELTDRRPGELIPGQGFKEWDRDKVLKEVLRFLGPDYYAQLDQEEEDPSFTDDAVSA